MSRPFVIAVASEKGGVGKTTIATNLAVYLKALREDLPVTVASFDNHFSVDQMFALGPQPEARVADLLDSKRLDELAVLGQYGVQYIASSRRLQQPDHPPSWLYRRLCSAVPSGLLILDTRPILDWFTEAALLAADLVLVPVKDRAALVNVGAFRDILAGVECVDRLWLLPSLVDTRARLNAEVRVHEFLVYSARERGYQVLDNCLSKSPKVEGLASGFSSRIRPVLTHARNTAVHNQFKLLAEFVLARSDEGPSDSFGRQRGTMTEIAGAVVAGQQRRLVSECPCCASQSLSGNGHLYLDLRSRRRGFFHSACFEKFCKDLGFEDVKGEESLLALTIDGPGLVGPECRVTAHLGAFDGSLLESERVNLDRRRSIVDSLAMMTGRSLDEAYRELLVINCTVETVEDQLSGQPCKSFALGRQRVTRELRQAGLF